MKKACFFLEKLWDRVLEMVNKDNCPQEFDFLKKDCFLKWEILDRK